jgi:hypothetical protein
MILGKVNHSIVAVTFPREHRLLYPFQLSENTISYNNLRELLVDEKMNRTDLEERSCIRTVSLAKLGKNETLPQPFC